LIDRIYITCSAQNTTEVWIRDVANINLILDNIICGTFQNICCGKFRKAENIRKVFLTSPNAVREGPITINQLSTCITLARARLLVDTSWINCLCMASGFGGASGRFALAHRVRLKAICIHLVRTKKHMDGCAFYSTAGDHDVGLVEGLRPSALLCTGFVRFDRSVATSQFATILIEAHRCHLCYGPLQPVNWHVAYT
jgi:hypothetical protein